MKKIIVLGLLAMGLCWPTSVLAAKISNLRTSNSPSKVRVVLDSDEPLEYTESFENNTLVLTLPKGKAKALKPALKDTLVQQIQLKPQGKGSQLMVKLNRSCKYKILKLKNPDRLVIDFPKIVVLRKDSQLAKGVGYSFIQDDFEGRQIQAYVVNVAPASGYSWKPFSAAGSYNGRARLSGAAARIGALAAINASYFDTDGWVVGTTKVNNRFMSMESEPHSAFVVSQGVSSIVKDVAYKGQARLSDGTVLEVKGMNRSRIADDLVVYNEFYAPSTRTNSWGREVKVRLKNHQVLAVSTLGNMTIEPGTIVLSGHGASAAALAKCHMGDQLVFTEELNQPQAQQAETVLGAGPLLLEQGQVHVRIQEEGIAKDIAYGRAPRTAIGVKKDGTVVAIVVDGRSSSSAGMTLTELARYLLKLGVWEAVNLDGGGSSELCLKGKPVNNPSDGQERPVSMGLGLFSSR